jgi:hypothetical protein
MRLVSEPNDLEMNRTAGQDKDRPAQAIAATEGFQHRQPDDVPVENERLVVVRALPHHSQRSCRKTRRPACAARLRVIHSDSLRQEAGRASYQARDSGDRR